MNIRRTARLHNLCYCLHKETSRIQKSNTPCSQELKNALMLNFEGEIIEKLL